MENMASLYSQYLKICKQNDEDVREFNDRFNTLLGRIEPNFHQESTILQQYLNSLKENSNLPSRTDFLQTSRKHKMLLAWIEENLRFNNSISSGQSFEQKMTS
jgi:hypothetical protein